MENVNLPTGKETSKCKHVRMMAVIAVCATLINSKRNAHTNIHIDRKCILSFDLAYLAL